MTHLDLFSGIGGFAYAVDQVWDNVEHIFCDNDKFCQQVLKKHWPNSKIYEDIRIITDTKHNGHDRPQGNEAVTGGHQPKDWLPVGNIDILTGGFPCQPFSQAGRRKGTDDNRYLWPEMLRLIRLTKPRWVIGENVAGLLTINEGLVFEQVCLDLETEGYEVQPFVIPAVAVNAPHRRDRVWFVANKHSNRFGTRTFGNMDNDTNINSQLSRGKRKTIRRKDLQSKEWTCNWLEVATELCRVDDGLPAELDYAGWTKAQHRVQRLKSLGNAIVPQVAVQIMEAIKTASED